MNKITANFEEMMALLFWLKTRAKTQKQEVILYEIIQRVECYEKILNQIHLNSYPMELPEPEEEMQ